MMSGPTRCSVCRWARTVSGFVCGEGQIRHLQDILLFLEAIAERCVKITFQYRLGDTGSISFKYFVYYYLKFLSNFYDCSGVQSFLSIVFQYNNTKYQSETLYIFKFFNFYHTYEMFKIKKLRNPTFELYFFYSVVSQNNPFSKNTILLNRVHF